MTVTSFLKKRKNWIIGILFPIAFAATVPVVPVEMKWMRSYETTAFDTMDGDLEINEYAETGDGRFYVRNIPKTEGQFFITKSILETVGKTKITIRTQKSPLNPDCVGCAYYSEFLDSAGNTVRASYDKTEYYNIGHVLNYPQPAKTEWKTILSPTDGNAAIAFPDGGATDGGSTTGTSLTFGHETTGSNRVLFVGATDDDVGASKTTGVTFATISMGQVSTDVQTPGDRWFTMWFLAAPATGLGNNVVISASASIFIIGQAASYTGAAQVDPEASGTATASAATSISKSLTTLTDNAWTIMSGKNNVGAFSAGTGSTQRISAANGQGTYDSNGPITPPASYSMTLTYASSGGSAVVMAVFAPAVEAAIINRPPIIFFEEEDY